ncbi:hypothetical protein CBR_g78821 [Chara braunii]|uniref:Uncharacterized protein n=1 Tax=Chara braunii TaxID=69332 RepID=A0A388KAG6_CHABU|nr:hypothetical protein CBR_g78821 [Chara braunii]|eukprot:GBG67040.1 hypothetical protein CBR_g78821 [Chara braunii]
MGLRVSSSMTMLTVMIGLMMMMMMGMPLRVIVAVGADISWTAQQRGGKSVAGAESAYNEEVGDMQGARELQAEPSSPFSVINTTLLRAPRVVLTTTQLLSPTAGNPTCFHFIRGVVFSSQTGVFFYLQRDSCFNYTAQDAVDRLSIHKCDMRGMAGSGPAQANSSLLTVERGDDNRNGTAVSDFPTSTRYLLSTFDLSRSEQHLVLPCYGHALAFVNTTDGSSSTYEISNFLGYAGAFNPNHTIFYVGNGSCLLYSVMDGDSPGSFVNDFRSKSCYTDFRSVLFGHRTFLQDGSYLYAWDIPHRTFLGLDLISGEVDHEIKIPQTKELGLGDFVLTQDGCSLFVVAYAGKYILRAAFEKPRGNVVTVENVITFTSAYRSIGTVALDNDDSHLYVSTSDGELFQFPINKSALGECSGAFPTPAAPTGATTVYPSASPASSTESYPSSSLSEPSPESSSSSPSPSPPAAQSIGPGAYPAAGASSSAGHDGSSTRVSGRSADTLSSPSPATVQTPPRGGVSVGVLAGSLVAACLVASILGGALVLLVSRSRKSPMAASGGMAARSTALENPVERLDCARDCDDDDDEDGDSVRGSEDHEDGEDSIDSAGGGDDDKSVEGSDNNVDGEDPVDASGDCAGDGKDDDSLENSDDDGDEENSVEDDPVRADADAALGCADGGCDEEYSVDASDEDGGGEVSVDCAFDDDGGAAWRCCFCWKCTAAFL